MEHEFKSYYPGCRVNTINYYIIFYFSAKTNTEDIEMGRIWKHIPKRDHTKCRRFGNRIAR